MDAPGNNTVVYHGLPIWTGRSGTTEALLVQEGIVQAKGSLDALRAKAPNAVVEDLAARHRRADGRPGWLGPGFRDPHAHVFNLGVASFEADLSTVRSAEALLECLRTHDAQLAEEAARASAAPEEWLLGQGYNEALWSAVPEDPRSFLDEAFGERPVFLLRIDRHAAWVNSAALDIAGIRKPGAVPGGSIEGQQGRPNGVLVDEAMNLVRQHWPPMSPEREAQAWLRAQARCFSEGLVGVCDMGLPWSVWERLLPLYADGRMQLPLVGTLTPEPETEAHFRRHGPLDRERLVLDAYKYYADGALGSRGARMLEPYSDAPDHQGLWLHDPKRLMRAAAQHAADGFRMVTHAIGDAAAEAVLEAYAQAPAGAGWRMEHAQNVPARLLPAFAEGGIWASVQTCHGVSDRSMVLDRIGAPRMPSAYRARSFLDAGVRLCNGTDFPIEAVSPLRSFATAVWRAEWQPDADAGQAPIRPEEALTREEALLAMTAWAAEAEGSAPGSHAGRSGMFHSSGAATGSLEPGHWFDAVLLDRSPLEADRASWSEAQVCATYVRGSCVFERSD
jgi:predicted amidohydrolase YtcJ